MKSSSVAGRCEQAGQIDSAAEQRSIDAGSEFREDEPGPVRQIYEDAALPFEFHKQLGKVARGWEVVVDDVERLAGGSRLIDSECDALGTVLDVRHRQFTTTTDDQTQGADRMAPTGHLLPALAPD